MRRALAAVVVVCAAGAPATAQTFDVDVAGGAVTPRPATRGGYPPRTCGLRAADPGGYELRGDAIAVRAGRRVVRERLRRDGEGFRWVLESDGVLVVGTQMHARPFGADRVFAIDRRTGRVLWRKALDTVSAANATGGRIVVEGGGRLQVIEARTGRVVAVAPSSPGLAHVCRGADHDVVKTSRDLVVLAADDGTVAWTTTASWNAAPAIVGSRVADVYMDLKTMRWGLTVRRLGDGAVERTIDLGEIGALDIVRFGLVPGAGDRLTVDAMFAWE